MSVNRVYGIDLGTTYSCIAYVDENGKPVVIPNSDSENTTPSVVYFESPDNIVVGQTAKNASKVEAGKVASFVKRSMGDPGYRFEVDGKAYTPEEVSAFVLRRLAGDAAEHLGEPVTDVVITCPAYFGNSQREATKNAGRIAGLNVLSIVNEPTAAAVCYGVQSGQQQVVLVYDLGGGTFDITLISVSDQAIEVIYTDGNHELGGKDWDDRLVTNVARMFLEASPQAADPMDDPQASQDLLLEVEKAKKALTGRDKYPLHVARTKLEVTRDVFEEWTSDLLEQTIQLTQKVIDQGAQRGHSKIDKILLVGGSSRMPMVARRLKEVFKLETQMFEPDLSVAKGAAIFGMQTLVGNLIKEKLAENFDKPAGEIDLSQVDKARVVQAAAEVARSAGQVLRLPAGELARMAEVKIKNVTSKSFGVVVVGASHQEEVAFLIHNNTSVPVQITETGFGIMTDNQPSVLVQVMEQDGQAESPRPADNRKMVEGEMAIPPGLSAGSPIHVTFHLESDGTLKITALEPTSRRDLQLVAKVDGVMTQQEVEESRSRLMRVQVSG